MRRRIRTDRKGISTIVGTVLFITIFIAGFNLMTWSVSVYDDYTQAVMERNQAELDRVQESISVVSARIDSDKFNLTVKNNGPTAARLVRLWVTNETASPRWHDKFDINLYMNPDATITNVGQAIDLTANVGNTYTLNIISERGNSASVKLLSVTDSNLILTLEASPPTPVPGTRVNVLFAVTNNETDTAAVYNLIPQLNVTGTATATLVSGPTPNSRSSLQPGSTAFFQWEYDVDGADSSTVTFNATLSNAKQGSYVLKTVMLQSIKFAEQSAVSGVASSVSAGTGNSDKLYWHDPAELDGKQMDPVKPEPGNEVTTTLSSSSTTIRFYTKPLNSSNIDIPSGDWKLKIYYKSVGSGSSTVRVIYEEVNVDGTSVISTIEDFNWNLGNENNVKKKEKQWSESAVTISAGNRLRLTMIWQSGADVELHYDKDNRDAHTKIPIPSPPFPTYSIFTGDDFWLTLTNNSNVTFFITFNSRAVFREVSSNTTYASFVKGWEELSGPPETSIDSNHDSRGILPGDSVRLHFEQPTTIPSKNADKGTAIPSGSYLLNIFITGYDANGGAVFSIINVGTITF